ncbi:MAG TPA: CocE/NonD family hydrolase [Steroidobacteraceae bacterium]|nr:CocE/NonD family hydrolase [Steroidobacteraceae bacterium]
MKRILLIAVLTLATSVLHAANAPPASAPDAASVQFNWGVKITLRDGIRLNATLYLPNPQAGPAPCVFTLTPYVSDTYHARGIYFAAHGYPFAIVDVRGRGNSEGIFHPMIQEARDGYDVVEWLARQPFCNGKVAMWGGSYAGYDQWATAKEFPPHLATIVPAASPYVGVDFPMRSNIFYPYLMQWLTYTSGRALQEQIFGDDAFWSSIYRRWYESGRPFGDLDAVLGNPSPSFHEWLAHPEPDAYWDAYNPTAEQYAQLRIPILTITASYDDDQPGALEHYRRYMQSATPEGRARHFLIIGPWDHAGTRTPRDTVGRLKFGPESLVDLPKLHLDWYRWTMLAGPKPAFLLKPVAYYVMGAERWRYTDTLDAITATRQTYTLDSTGRADDPYATGMLAPGSAKGPPDSYRYDPRDVSGPEIDAEARVSGSDLTDQTVFNGLRGKELIYQTAPFEADTEVSGFFKLSAWIAIDAPDTDLYVSVHRIAPDGSSVLLATDALRARYREGPRSPKPIRSRDPLLYEFGHFTFVSREIKRGERLRLVIAPLGRIIETTFVQKNYQGGGVVAEESAKDARAVTVRLFHDRSHPSTLSVPIGRPE